MDTVNKVLKKTLSLQSYRYRVNKKERFEKKYHSDHSALLALGMVRQPSVEEFPGRIVRSKRKQTVDKITALNGQQNGRKRERELEKWRSNQLINQFSAGSLSIGRTSATLAMRRDVTE